MRGISRALSPGILKFPDNQELGRIFASTPCSHSKWHRIFVLQFTNCFFLLSIYSVLQYKGEQILYELHFLCTAPACLGTGKTLKKPKGSAGSILKKKKKKRTPNQKNTKKPHSTKPKKSKQKKFPSNNGRCLNYPAPSDSSVTWNLSRKANIGSDMLKSDK